MDKSYCRDVDGQEVEDVLSITPSGVNVQTDQTVYCTLYFENSEARMLIYDPIKSGTQCTTVQCALDELYKILY